MIKRFFILCILVLFFETQFLSAQTVKNISISQGNSFTDHLSLSSDNHDMDLIVKLIFDEDKNQLIVSILSYRYLFVFRENVRYGSVIHHNRLEPLDLPYITDFPEKGHFFLSKQFRKSIPKPQKKYIFKRWINYQGLQPVPMQFKMVNDYIEQVFDITNNGKDVSVDLGYVVVMDKTTKKHHADDYTLIAGKDLNISYRIKIERNPCFGKDEESDLAQNTLNAILEAFSNFKSLYGKGVVENQQELTNFENLKSVLMTQFQAKNSDSGCPQIKATWDEYDNYVDSISLLTCEIRSDENKPTGNINFDSTEITALVRQIDRNISRWLISNDNVEKQDLLKECEDIISEVNGIIGKSQGTTPEQKKAISLFKNAELYFRNTCVKKK